MIHGAMSQAEIDAAFNSGAVVPELPDVRKRWESRSMALRTRADHLDLRYGPRPRQRLDLFLAAGPFAPTLAYIHGGYWQANDKENYAFVAEGPLAHGINVAVLEHTLTPEVTLDELVGEIREAVDWLARHLADHGADPGRLILGGHSAGGHLTAMLAGHPAVAVGFSISGLFDLQLIRLSYLNAKLRLGEEEAERNSPMRHVPRPSCPLVIAYGGAELGELQRQSIAYATACADVGIDAELICVPGTNHFTIVEELADPEGSLARKLKSVASALAAPGV